MARSNGLIYALLFGGGGLAEYIKRAEVSQDGKTLTLTNQNGTEIPFSPDGGMVIQSNNTTQAGDWDVPELTSEQVIQAYNALVAGQSVTIQDENGDIQFKALLGNATPANPYIVIQYYWFGWVEYQAGSDTTATAIAHKISEPSIHQITSVTVGDDTIDITIS